MKIENKMRKGITIGLIFFSIFALFVNSQDETPISWNISQEGFDGFTMMGINYLKNSYSDGKISNIHASTYTHYDSGLTYAIIKAKLSGHRGHVRAVVRHKDGKVFEDERIIHEDWREYINNLPSPYNKMDYALRAGIKRDYGKLIQSNEVESLNVTKKYPIVFTTSDGSLTTYETPLADLLEIGNQPDIIRISYIPCLFYL